ncbi:MAG: hypothetical protein EZS28_019116 [Streblomastix strix]|uniref:Uncharacterized protein n=1 Tax=Streblomastix strix TaxID=222440 RepID=A0A5J4VS02_9EUKA|nr:MAG: hypothetical protein EZS28_019116 [Streblomastix strix]
MNKDDALLLLKAYKSELIDAYSKTEADALLDDKLNICDQIDAYTKQEDDDLLLLKADKSELIDAYSKTEANALLDEKLNVSDQIVAYSKMEADALLDDKFNISDQIDTYNKQEDDALLLLKADKTQLIDAYSKTEADAKLDEKLKISVLIARIFKASRSFCIFRKQQTEVALVGNGHTSALCAGLMSHIKFFSPDSVNGSACIPVIKSAVHPNYPLGQSVKAENIKRSSSGILTLTRIGIVYGAAV